MALLAVLSPAVARRWMYLPRPPPMDWAGGQGLGCSIHQALSSHSKDRVHPCLCKASVLHEEAQAIVSTHLPTFSLPGPGGAKLRSGWHQAGRALTLFCPLCVLGCRLIGFSHLLDKHWLSNYCGLSPVLVLLGWWQPSSLRPLLHFHSTELSLSLHPRLVLCHAVLLLLCLSPCLAH